MTSTQPVQSAILNTIAISTPFFAAGLIAIYPRAIRIVGFLAAIVSAAATTLLLYSTSSLYQVLMLLFSLLSIGATLVLPQRDCNARQMAGILWILGSTLMAYSTANLIVFLAAWMLSALPFFLPAWLRGPSARPWWGLFLSCVAISLSIALVGMDGQSFAIDSLKGQSPGGAVAFALLVIAVIFRKGIFPAHAWVPGAVESGAAIPTALLLNGHFGALVVAKLILPLFPQSAGSYFPVLSYLAIATAVYVAIRALTENSPRRLIAMLALSQSACILAGLESRNVEGITGALLHWFVVTVSTVGLLGVTRLLEVRFGENLTASKHLGLVEHAPRLAVFFALFGLALVGLPGTLSFCSQDLLTHGTLLSHPLTGLLLPVATAMNAISVFRLFTRLFLGRKRTGFTIMADALPRERWAFAAAVVFIVSGGLFPSTIVNALASATERLASNSEVTTEAAPATQPQASSKQRDAGF